MKAATKKILLIGGLAALGAGAYLVIKRKNQLPDGTFLRDPVSGAIYVIENGQKRHIQSMETWLKLSGGKIGNDQIDTDPSILDKIPTGPSLAGLGRYLGMVNANALQ